MTPAHPFNGPVQIPEQLGDRLDEDASLNGPRNVLRRSRPSLEPLLACVNDFGCRRADFKPN